MSNYHHPEGGEVVAVSVDGQLYINPANADYLKSQSPSSLNQIKKDTVNSAGTTHSTSAGFSKGKVISNSSDDREETLERLSLLKNQRARLLKDLERVDNVIKSIEEDLII